MELQELQDLVNEIRQSIEEVRAQIYTLQRQKRALIENLLILFDEFYVFVYNNVNDPELKEKIKKRYFEMLNLIKQKIS
ncbi:MAG: hypothetical protein ACP5GJ_04120 [Nanopusillaceae archaeon]